MPHRVEHIGLVLVLAGMITLGIPSSHVNAAPPPLVASTSAFPQQGEHSKGVVQLQRLLASAGVPVPGGADGVYGPATARAVRRFQRFQGLPVTGTVDQATAIALGLVASPAADTTLDVTEVQRRLISVGARPKGGADGVLGSATRAAVTTFQRWMGLPPTGDLDAETLDALVNASGASGASFTPSSLGSFPLPLTCMFWDTWGAPRSGGRVHQGVDLFASVGTPVFAVADGRITQQRADFPGSLGGNQLWLTTADGSRYFYGHLSRFAKGVGTGSPVHAGNVIGYAGATGLATVPHLHFEIHPGGGTPVNPYPVLKKMVNC